MKFTLKTFKIKRLRGYQGYGVTIAMNFFFNFLELKGYEVTKVTRVRGVTIAMNFFLQIFRIKKLRGYQGYQGYGGNNSQQGSLSS